MPSNNDSAEAQAVEQGIQLVEEEKGLSKGTVVFARVIRRREAAKHKIARLERDLEVARAEFSVLESLIPEEFKSKALPQVDKRDKGQPSANKRVLTILQIAVSALKIINGIASAREILRVVHANKLWEDPPFNDIASISGVLHRASKKTDPIVIHVSANPNKYALACMRVDK